MLQSGSITSKPKVQIFVVLFLAFAATCGIIQPPETRAAPGVASASAEQQAALDRINYYRSLAGVPLAHLNPSLVQSATSHANYVSLNGWNGNPHEESSSLPGYSGVTMSDRAQKFGFNGSVNEDMDSLGQPVGSIDALMNTVSHRTPILEPAYTEIGYGFATGKNAVDVISFGALHSSWNYDPPIIQWPPNNFTSFGTRYWGESPSSLSGVSFPIGNPVTLTYRGSGKMELVAEECNLVDQQTGKLDSITGTGNFFTTRGTFIMAARKPLALNHSFTATMVFKIDGQKQSRAWSFSTGTASPPASTPTPTHLPPLPQGVGKALAPIQTLWTKFDGQVGKSKSGSTWFYGPDVNMALNESYQESPNAKRNVWYFDKARLEITRPSGDASSEWYVTSGLLVRELIQGKVQAGDIKFEEGPGAAQVAIAGDLNDNAGSPTYATFNSIASLNNDRRASNRTGQEIQEVLSRDGRITVNEKALGVKFASYDTNLGHNIPDVFVNYFKNLPGDWVFIMGLPLTEPYWTRAKVGGIEKDVMVQAFERRVLTYTPTNELEWRVEMGNVGLHYQVWRYGARTS